MDARRSSMADDTLPPELREFIAEHIDSIAQLEALLLVRSTRDQAWDTQTAATRLYVGEQEAFESLEHLADHGLLAREAASYRFHPSRPEMSRTVDLLAEYYRRHLVSVTNLIHAKPRRIRQFADAFKLKKRD